MKFQEYMTYVIPEDICDSKNMEEHITGEYIEVKQEELDIACDCIKHSKTMSNNGKNKLQHEVIEKLIAMEKTQRQILNKLENMSHRINHLETLMTSENQKEKSVIQSLVRSAASSSSKKSKFNFIGDKNSKISFKIWSADRLKKTAIVVPKSSSLYIDLILLAGQKLEIYGSKIVLENDGTEIDDESLEFFSQETLILLGRNEVWFPSTPSTFTAPIVEPNNSPASIVNTFQDTRKITALRESICDDSWENFDIPWKKLDLNLLRDCLEGNRKKSTINSVVNLVVNEMRKKTNLISSKSFKIIARKLVEKYPLMFKDADDDNFVFGDGVYSIYKKLLDHNNYLNRPTKRKSLDTAFQVSIPLRKRKLFAQASCSNWEPNVDVILNGESEYQMLLKSMATRELSEAEQEHAKLMLEQTFLMQRTFLNNKPTTIEDVMEEWPILLKPEFLFWHYEKLMGHSIHDLEKNLIIKQEKIINFGIAKTNIAKSSFLESDEPVMLVMRIIFNYFKEDFDSFFKIVKPQCAMENAEAPMDGPCILFKDSEFDKNYYCFIEGKRINNGSKSFINALKEAFAAYYIFNLNYPPLISTSLEFFQRYILNINPEVGSKNVQDSNSKFKILNLIKQFT